MGLRAPSWRGFLSPAETMRFLGKEVKAVDRAAAPPYLAAMNKAPSTQPPGLDDPRYANHAWRRFRRMLFAMAAAAMAFALAVVAYLWGSDGPLPWIFVGLTIFGIWATIMMAALLMGLMFLSSGTGHDHKVEDRISKDVLEKHEEG
jgi:hypothetical protein